MLDYKELQQYFNGTKKRLSYNDATYAYDYLRFHFDGPDSVWRAYSANDKTNVSTRDYAMDRVMLELIHARRPSETEEIWAYRKTIFECITKEVTSAVLRSLSKIKRSDDWSVRYSDEIKFSQIAEGETLEDYCEWNFPFHYDSVTNWAFAILLKNLLIDPNAVCLIMPLNEPVEANEYRNPYPIIYNSNQVYEYKYDEYAVLLSVEKTDKNGKIFLFVDDTVIEKWAQKGTTNDFELVDTYMHGLGEMPCFKLPGVFRKSYATDFANESHLSSMVPSLNEAAREYSDLQAEVVMHVFSETVEYASQKCEECYNPVLGQSTGTIGTGKKAITCQKCNGTGLMGAAPYKKTVLRNPKLDEQPIPIPGKWYIQKQIDIAKLQAERITEHKFNALATVNMQFLAQTPLNQSGKAKEVDKDELNNFIYAIASDIIKAMNRVYYYVNEYRYKDIIPSKTDRRKQLPSIPIPQQFDLLSGAYLIGEIQSARGDAKLNNITLQAMEIEYVQKKAGMLYTKAADTLSLIFDLDPFPDANDDEKLARKMGGGITDIDYCISCNIMAFVKKAMDDDEKFIDAARELQVAKMQEYAKPIVDSYNLKMKAQQAALAIKIPTVPENN